MVVFLLTYRDKFPPTYPVKYASWVALAWALLGVALTVFLVATQPAKLRDTERVYVEDEMVAAGARPATEPA